MKIHTQGTPLELTEKNGRVPPAAVSAKLEPKLELLTNHNARNWNGSQALRANYRIPYRFSILQKIGTVDYFREKTLCAKFDENPYTGDSVRTNREEWSGSAGCGVSEIGTEIGTVDQSQRSKLERCSRASNDRVRIIIIFLHVDYRTIHSCLFVS